MTQTPSPYDGTSVPDPESSAGSGDDDRFAETSESTESSSGDAPVAGSTFETDTSGAGATFDADISGSPVTFDDGNSHNSTTFDADTSGSPVTFDDTSDSPSAFGTDIPVGPSTFDTDTSDGNPSAKDAAKDEAAKVADTGVRAAKDVAGTAKEEASNVVAETKQQAKSLFESARGEIQSQGGAQQQRLASTLHSFAQELDGMASGTDQSGPLTDLVKQAATKGGEFADWLDAHEPADLLREVQTFARRRPVAFLALCGMAGVLAGRIARGAAAANTSLDSGSKDRDLPRLAERPADTDGAGLGYSDLLGSSPEVRSGDDQFGTRFGDPAGETYESGLGTAGIGGTPHGTASSRPGEA